MMKVILTLLTYIIGCFVAYSLGYNAAYNTYKPSNERKLFVTSGDRCFSLDETLTATEINCKDDKDDRRK